METGTVYNVEHLPYSEFVKVIVGFLLFLIILVIPSPFFEETSLAPEARHVAPIESPSQRVAVVDSDVVIADTLPIPTSTPKTPQKDSPLPPQTPPTSPPETDVNQVVRIQAPYTTPPLSFEEINVRARGSLVNILCTTPTSTFNPTSGSGIVINNNLILTNAHVAQYVLLQDATFVDITCVVRTGSPAYPIGTARVAFMPRAWVQAHAQDILSSLAKSTGEYDVALISMEPLSGGTTPVKAPYDTREAIAFIDDPVLVLGYPASFLGGILIQKSLSALSAVTTIPEVLTFSQALVDAVSLGPTILAQQGSSGGGVFNQYGYLVGIITTSSQGETTDERTLRAISLAHIDRTFRKEAGMSLQQFIEQAPAATLATSFASTSRELVLPFLKALQLGDAAVRPL